MVLLVLWFSGSIGSISSLVLLGSGSIGSMVLLVLWFFWFYGSIGSMVLLRCISSMVLLFLWIYMVLLVLCSDCIGYSVL